MATEYGKILRKIRIDCGEVLGDMAENLEISSSYLSSIETGSRKVPENFTDLISERYVLQKSIIKKLRKAELVNLKEVKLPFNDKISDMRKETAVIFARTFNNINDDDMEKIRAILVKREEKN